jgi:hypothetical protein
LGATPGLVPPVPLTGLPPRRCPRRGRNLPDPGAGRGGRSVRRPLPVRVAGVNGHSGAHRPLVPISSALWHTSGLLLKTLEICSV